MKPVTNAIGRRAGGYLQQYRRSHQGIDLVDHVVAATAEQLQAELLTLNVKHFPMVAQLEAPWVS